MARKNLWPTPSATDYKGSVSGETLSKRRAMTRGVRLPEAIMRMFPTPVTTRPHDSENTAGKFMPRTEAARFDGGGGAEWWATEPDVGRVADGVPSRLDRLKCLGNAVVPQIPEIIGRAIMRAADKGTVT